MAIVSITYMFIEKLSLDHPSHVKNHHIYHQNKTKNLKLILIRSFLYPVC